MNKMWIATGVFSHLVELEKRQNTIVTFCDSADERQTAIQHMVQWVVETFDGVVWDNTDAIQVPGGLLLLKVSDFEREP